MKTKFLIPLFPLFLCLTGCGDNKVTADLVVFNNIFTAENDFNTKIEAFAVKDGKYIYVGNKEGANNFIVEGKTKVVDGNNQGLVIPGATEGHGHYLSGVGLNSQLPGSEKSYEEVLDILRQKVAEGITQFVSFGWESQDLVERRRAGENFAEEIEEIAPGIPVILIDNTGHGAMCNKTAFEMAGIDKSSSVRGGILELDKDGNLSGYVADQSVYYVIDKGIKNLLNEEQNKNACEYGVSELLRLGYTNTLDAFTNMYNSTGIYKALKQMDDEKKLTLNIVECYNIKSYDSEIYKTRVDEVKELVNKYSSSHLYPNYIKLFTDGVVEAKTGWMIEPYADGTYGNIIWNQPELDAITSYANHNDILIHAHTYGDAACRSALNAFVTSNEINGNQYRNCLAHVRNITNEDAIRAAQNNIPIAANLLWHTDYEEGDIFKQAIIRNIGEERYYAGYPMKSLMDKGINVSSSTDAPAAASLEGSIMNVLEACVTGQEPLSTSIPFATNELLSVEQGLKALTINGAWQLGIEKERGSIKVGKYADFVILDKNILNYQGTELRKIHETNILSTYFEGQEVYKNKITENYEQH